MQSLTIRDVLPELEEAMLQEPQVPCPVTHSYGPGIYIREVFIPAGTFAIGHHQNHRHVNIMLKGKVTMLEEDGSLTLIEAPFFYIGEPGRKVGYIHEDMIWQNVYATEETDVEKLEEEFLTKSAVFSECIYGAEQLDREEDREDFLEAIALFGVTADTVRQESERDDVVPLEGSYSIQVGDSCIEGKGLFATASILNGEVIAPALIEGKRTIAGRYTNHAKNPNCVMVLYDNGDMYLHAIQDIIGQHGGQLGEELTVDYRQVLSLHEVLP